VPVTKLRFPVFCSARWGEVLALHHVLDVVHHVLRSQSISGARSRSEICRPAGCARTEWHRDVGRRSNGREKDRSQALTSCATSGTTVTVRCCSGRHTMFLNFSLSRGDRSCNSTSSIAHPVSTQEIVNVPGDEPGAHDSDANAPGAIARSTSAPQELAEAAVRAAEMIELSSMAKGYPVRSH